MDYRTSVSPTDCSEINKGRLSLKGKNDLNLKDFCGCDFESVELKRIPFAGFPDCFPQMELTSVKIEQVPLSEFPRDILSFSQLETLSFRRTGLADLPAEVAGLKSLKSLDLRGTSISSLPEGLSHLEKIDLRMCEISNEDQVAMRMQYPNVKIYFSSPCNCN